MKVSTFYLVLKCFDNIFCLGLCSRQEIIDESFSASCDRDGEDFPCSDQLLPGIKALIRCKTGFMTPKGLVNPELTCEESGNWSQSAHKCEKIKETATESPKVKSGGS